MASIDPPKNTQLDILDTMANQQVIARVYWINKPNIATWKYTYSPTFSDNGKTLLFNYLESDEAYLQRIKRKNLISISKRTINDNP